MFNSSAPKMGVRKWITRKELVPFFKLPVWLLGLKEHWKLGFQPLLQSIIRLWSTNGSVWLVQYLTETSRALVCWAGKEKFVPSKAAQIALTRKGLPKIIPIYLRKRLILMNWSSEESKLLFRCLLTVLSCYRVMACYPKLKLGTITGPFTGLTRTLPVWEISNVINLLPKGISHLAHPDLLTISESAGPNYPKATWGAPLDALAFAKYPFVWISFQRYCYALGYHNIALWQGFLMIISLPISLVLWLLGSFSYSKLILGRLVGLPEARGKVRVIAIGDYWTQLAFKPLHDAIFSILKEIPQDGTFNQVKPLDDLIDIARLNGQKLDSFDLSAATDRLPIDFQIQVLTLLGINGRLWANLLRRDWRYTHDKDNNRYEDLRYSVGQPMGLYSSWAMLALSHHVIVQMAASRAGHKGWFRDYAVLGDDVVIANAVVSQNYLSLMASLGVEINMAKSHRGSVAEFAKRWVSPSLGELSPIGAGNILITVRNPRFIPSLLVELRAKAFGFPITQVRHAIASLSIIRRNIRNLERNYIGMAALGPSGLAGSGSPQSGQALDLWFRSLSEELVDDMPQIVYNAFRRSYTNECSSSLARYRKGMETFSRTWSRFPVFAQSFVSFNAKHGLKHPLNTIYDILFMWGARPTYAINVAISYSLSALITRVSPSYYAYKSVPDPFQELWLKANDMPFEYTADYDDLSETFRAMASDLGELSAGAGHNFGWQEKPPLIDFVNVYRDTLDRIYEIYSTWYGPECSSLVPYVPRDVPSEGDKPFEPTYHALY